jgi:antitoxin ChpS
MQTTTLRRVGGSIMMTVPPALLEQMHLEAGSTVGIAIEGERLIVQRRRPKYTLKELLAECDPNAPISDEDREWLDAPAMGKELL